MSMAEAGGGGEEEAEDADDDEEEDDGIGVNEGRSTADEVADEGVVAMLLSCWGDA